MPNVTAIIFSKDRACQLDALLASLRSNMADYPLAVDVTVLWTASDDEYAVGYARCMTEHPEARFWYEHDFAADYRAMLPADGHVVHFTDDAMLHRRINLAHAAWELDADDQVLAFALRMGVECVRCFPYDCAQRLPIFAYSNPPLLLWNWPGGDLDWGYAASLDGNVFRVEDVRRLIDGAVFSSPNSLEEALAGRVHRLSGRPRLASYRHAALTCVPANRVQSSHPNRVMPGGTSARALNGAYLDGARIDHHSMDWGRVDAAHCAIPFAWTGKAMAA